MKTLFHRSSYSSWFGKFWKVTLKHLLKRPWGKVMSFKPKIVETVSITDDFLQFFKIFSKRSIFWKTFSWLLLLERFFSVVSSTRYRFVLRRFLHVEQSDLVLTWNTSVFDETYPLLYIILYIIIEERTIHLLYSGLIAACSRKLFIIKGEWYQEMFLSFNYYSVVFQ